MALAAIGLKMDLRKLRAEGLKPPLLAAAAWIFISIFCTRAGEAYRLFLRHDA